MTITQDYRLNLNGLDRYNIFLYTFLTWLSSLVIYGIGSINSVSLSTLLFSGFTVSLFVSSIYYKPKKAFWFALKTFLTLVALFFIGVGFDLLLEFFGVTIYIMEGDYILGKTP